jgi:hypothetical protein
MEETKKEIGYIESVELFIDTMNERFIKGNKMNCLILVAGCEEGVQVAEFGDANARLFSMADAIKKQEQFSDLVKAATALVKLSDIFSMDSAKEMIRKSMDDLGLNLNDDDE